MRLAHRWKKVWFRQMLMTIIKMKNKSNKILKISQLPNRRNFQNLTLQAALRVIYFIVWDCLCLYFQLILFHTYLMLTF